MDESSYIFEPHPFIRNGTLQTILAAKFPGNIHLPRRIMHRIRVEPNSHHMLYEIPPQDKKAPIVILGHGMAGCSESGYMRRIARKLHSKGLGVIMTNQRGSGPGLGFSDRLWNGGASDDLESVIKYVIRIHPTNPLLLVGFSLGGNVLLKYLGEGRKVPSNVLGAFAVNPPIDLKSASGILSRKNGNGLFSKDYMKQIHGQVEAMGECFPDTFLPARKAGSIREFDILYTAPAAGYQNVDEYYKECSSKQYLANIKAPTVVLCSQDDPFIPPDVFKDAHFSLCVEFISPESGGHMGYLSASKTSFGDRRWMDSVIVKWAQEILS